MFGAAGRSGYAGRHADHCQGGHSRAAAMREPSRDRAEGRYSECGFPERRPSGPPRLLPRTSQRRPIGAVARGWRERAATAPMARRRPASWLEQPHRGCVPRGLPGIGIVRGVEAAGKASLAQCRARHAPVEAITPKTQIRPRHAPVSAIGPRAGGRSGFVGDGPPSSSSASGATRARTMPSWSSVVRGRTFCCPW